MSRGMQVNLAHIDPFVFGVSIDKFNLDYTLESAQSFVWDKLEVAQFSAWKGIVQNELVVALQRPDSLEVYTHLSRKCVANYFSLDENFKFGDVIKSLEIESEYDEVLLSALHAFPGLRILRQDLWETIACFISSQNSSVEMIRERVRLLRENLGDELPNGDFAFPSPSVIANASLEKLLKCKMGYRAAYLRESAALISSGDFSLRDLKKMSFDKARGYLMLLPGVGPKVADCICLFSLGHLNAFPVDTHVFQVLTDFYNVELRILQGNRKKLHYGDLAVFGNRKFGTFCGYGQQYLFHLHRIGKESLEKVYS